MEMLIMASGGLNSIASSLGHMEGDNYIISEYCEDVLEEMLDNLKLENKVTRPVRINIANSKVLEGDLMHILSAAKDNVEAFQAIVKLLVNLSMPLEVILPVHPNMTKADWEQRHTLQDMLLKIKKHFVQEAPVRAILEQMSTELEHHGSYRMDKESMESMNDCLILVRNILHIEESPGMGNNNDIVKHLLDNNFSDIIHSMLSREEAEIWISAMVQVVRLMFRDQMSQDLVKRAAKLYKKETLFASTLQETQPGSSSPEKTSTDKVEVDLKSPWKILRESSPPGNGDYRGHSGSDSGFTVTESLTTESTIPKGLPTEKNPDEIADDEMRGMVKDGNASAASEQSDYLKGQRSETSGVSSGIDTSPSMSPSPRNLSTDEESLRDSPIGFALGDNTAGVAEIGKTSPKKRSVDSKGQRFGCGDLKGRRSETSGVSSGIDTSPDMSPSPRALSTDEDSLRDSPTGFVLSDNREMVKVGKASVGNKRSEDTEGQRLPTSGSSSGIDTSPSSSPSHRDLLMDEDYLRGSPTGFSLTDNSSTYSSEKDSPCSMDASSPDVTKPKTGKKSAKKQKGDLCGSREGPRGSPESQASEEDDTCSRTSGNGSTFSRSSDNSSSSFTGSSETGSSETGSSFSNSTTSMDGTPSEQELLRNRLCKFAVRFCQHGLNRLILLSQDNLLQRVNDCYVLWCMSYFLPFSSLPCISYSDVRYNLSSMVVTYLMYVALNTWESFTLATDDVPADSKSNILFRRLYLLVASLRQILSSTRRFMEKELDTDERESLSNFIKCLCHLEGLRKLYLLLLRKFRPKNESVQYLRALVVSNDELLRIITSEQAYAIVGTDKFNCEEHIKQLASRQVLLTYNELLMRFSSNTLEENEAAFTLMYHTAVDLRNHKLVYQLSILDTFANLWERGAENCISQSSWDFMDHIVTVFAQNSMDNPDILMEHITASPTKKRKHEEIVDSSEDEYSPYKKSCIIEGGLSLPTVHSSSEDEVSETNQVKDSTKSCIKALTIKGYKPQIRSLQKLLLETCYAQLACPKTEVVEPVVWLNHIQMKSVPLFAFSQADELAMNDLDFQELLQRLGMHSAKDSQHLYPSIPAFWTAEMCFSAAKMLGDVNCDKLSFALTPEGELSHEYLELQVPCTTFDPIGRPADAEMGQEPDQNPTTSRVSNPMASLPKNMWLTVVQQLNAEKEAKA